MELKFLWLTYNKKLFIYVLNAVYTTTSWASQGEEFWIMIEYIKAELTELTPAKAVQEAHGDGYP